MRQTVTQDGRPGTANLTHGTTQLSESEEKAILEKLKGRLSEDTVEGHFERGQLYLMAGEQGVSSAFASSLEDFDWVLKKEPKHPGALNNRGMAYARMGQMEKALADFKTLSEVKPDEPKGHEVYATLLAKSGKEKEAIAAYGKAVALGGPAGEAARFNRGNAYLRLGNRDLAKKDFEELLKTSKNPQILKGAKMNLEAAQ